MKMMMMAFVLSFCANSYAVDTTIGATGISISKTIKNKSVGHEEAVMKEINEYYKSGVISELLAEEIKDIQAQFNVSEREAVDMLADIIEIITSSK